MLLVNDPHLVGGLKCDQALHRIQNKGDKRAPKTLLEELEVGGPYAPYLLVLHVNTIQLVLQYIIYVNNGDRGGELIEVAEMARENRGFLKHIFQLKKAVCQWILHILKKYKYI